MPDFEADPIPSDWFTDDVHMENPEYFGNDFQVALQEKCLKAWPDLATNPRINFSGRNFGWDELGLDDINAIIDLANNFGVISVFGLHKDIRHFFIENIESLGLDLDTWEMYRSDESSNRLSAGIIDTANLDGYRIELVDPSTPAREVKEFQAVMQENGIAPLPGYVLRGVKLKSVSVMVKDEDNSIAATAVGVLRHHPKGPFGNTAHVGYLATKKDHRRNGLAKTALAKVNQLLKIHYGIEHMHTGVREGNIASKKTCEACGLHFYGNASLVAIFQSKISGDGQFTR